MSSTGLLSLLVGLVGGYVLGVAFLWLWFKVRDALRVRRERSAQRRAWRKIRDRVFPP